METSIQIRWSSPGIEDLKGLYDQIARHDRAAAASYARQVTNAVASLLVHPRKGIAMRDLPLEGELRSLRVRNHRIVYRVEAEIIQIYRVWDCRRDPAGLWEALSAPTG